MNKQELAALVDKLIEAQSASERFAELVRDTGKELYVIDKSQGTDVELGGMSHFELIKKAWCDPHPPADATVSSTFMLPGIVVIDRASSYPVLQALSEANHSRVAFAEHYSNMRKTMNNKHRLPEQLRQATTKLHSKGQLTNLVYMLPGILISTRQVKRKIQVWHSPEKISIYREQLHRREKITQDWLDAELSGMSAERAALIADKVRRHGDLNTIRRIVDSQGHRYRVNIDYGAGARANKASTIPNLVVGDMPDIVPFGSRSEARQGASNRKDKRNYFPVAEELGLYAIQ